QSGRALRYRDRRPAAQGYRRSGPDRLGLYPGSHGRQAADRHRGTTGAAGAPAEDGEDAAVPEGRRDSAAVWRADAGLRERGTQAAPIGAQMSGTFTAIDGKTNKIAWQHKTPYRIGGGGGATVTGGGLVFRGEPDGNFLAIDAKTGQELWRFQTGFGADAPPVVYEVDGEQFVVIATGGNQLQGSANGDAVWAFSLKGQVGPLWPPPPPPTIAGPVGPIAAGVEKIKMGGHIVEYSFVTGRVRIRARSTWYISDEGTLLDGESP